MASAGRLIRALMLASTSVAASSIAKAQTAPAAAPADTAAAAAANANASASPLGDIIVTARRTAENLQKVPLAVTVLSGDSLRKQAITAPADLGNKVPSLSVGTSNANRDSANYSIRGQGQAFGGSEPAVITYFAEVPTNVVGPGLLFDLQNVQVLKGPQGTLFGRNTTGGAILLEPKRPTDQLGGYGQFDIGSYSLRHFQGALNVPILGDKIMLRGAVDINRRDGFTKDVVTGVDYDNRHYEAYRLGLTIKPFDGFENYTVVNYSHSNTNGSGSVLTNVRPGSPGALAFPDLFAELAAQEARGPREVEHSVPDPYDRIRNLGVTNITTWKLNDVITLKNVAGYRHFWEQYNVDIDGSPAVLVDYDASPFNLSGSSSSPSTKTYSDELQVQGDLSTIGLKWVAGGYIEHQKPDSSTNQDWVQQIGSPVVIYQGLKNDHSKAIFGQADYKLPFLDGLKVTGGLRYTWDTRDQIARLGFRDIPVCFLTDADASCTVHDHAKFHALTYNASLQYQVTPSTLVYFTARKGYKSGGFNSNSETEDQRAFQPETVNDLEIGLKTQFTLGDVKGRFNVNGYRGKFHSIQITRNVSGASGNAINITGNIGAATIQGVEAELTLVPVKPLSISAFYAYTDAHYTKVDYSDPITGLPVDLTYMPFSNTPKNKLGVSATFSTPLGTLGDFSITGAYTYQSKTYFLIPVVPIEQRDPNSGQKGYSLVSMHAELGSVAGTKFDLGVFVNNVTNKKYLIFQTDFYPTDNGFTSGLYGEPRMFGFSVRYHFGGE